MHGRSPGARGHLREKLVRADIATLWTATHDAAWHTRWDLRFTSTTDEAPQSSDAPRAFRHALRLPGRTIAGTGTSIGER